MSQTTWSYTSGNGDFSNSGDWSGGVPTNDDQGFLVGVFDVPLTVTVGSADVIAPFSLLSLFDATLAVSGGTITIGTLQTSDDTLSNQLSELVVSNSSSNKPGLLTIQNASTVGSFVNAQVVGLTQFGGTVVFQNGSLSSATSALEGGAGGVQQSAGTIEVDYGTLDIYGNSFFAGTFASMGGAAAAGSTGTVILGGGANYNFNSGVVLDVHEVELQGAGTTLQLNKGLTDQFTFAEGSGTTIDLAGNSLTFELSAALQTGGAIDLLGGTIATSGTVVNAGKIDDSGLTLRDSVLFENTSTVDQNAGIVIGIVVGSATTLENVGGASYVIDASGPSVISGTGLFVNAGLFATSTQTPAGAASAITAQFSNETTGTILVTAGTLDFANNDNFTGLLTGAGMVELSGSGSNTLEAGVTLSSSAFYVSAANGGGQLQVDVLGSLTYSGVFLQDPGTTVQLLPATVGTKTEAPVLTLTNTSDVSGVLGGTFFGGNTAFLVLDATTDAPLSDNGMITRGALTVVDKGTVSQEGVVTIGQLSGDFETQLIIGQGAASAIYEFVAPSVLTGDGTITNLATFEQAAQITGASQVSAFFTSTATVICESGTLQFTGSDTFGGTITGSGLVELSGAVFTLNSGLLVTVSTLEVSGQFGAAQVDLLGSLIYNKNFIQTGATTLELAGTLSSGTYANQPTLTLNGISQLGGTINGLAPFGVKPAELIVSKTGSASDSGMVLTGAVTLLDQGQIGQQGGVVIGQSAGDFHTSVQIAVGASYNLTAASNISGDGSITNYGTFVQSISVTGVSDIGTDLISADTVTTTGTTTIQDTPTIASEGGILEFTGADVFSGTITGTGTVALSAASFTFAANLASVTVAALEVTDIPGAADVAILGTLLNYGGLFTQTGGTTLSLDGATTLELTGADDQVEGTVDGVGGTTPALVQWSGVDGTDTGLDLSGNVTLVDAGKIGQSAFVSIGVNAGDFNDLLQINAGKLYNLSEQSTISGAGSILNLGTFEQGVSVTGTSLVAIDFTSNASGSVVLGTTGTLLFTGADTFGGTITGAGAVALSDANFTFDASIVVTIATLELSGFGTDLTILGNLTYAGELITGLNTTISLAPGVSLDLVGSSNTLDGTIESISGGLLYQSSGSVSGLTLSGSETLFDTGSIGQTGIVTVGINAGDSASLIIDKNAAYNFRAQSLLTGNGSVVNNGQFGQGSGASITNVVNVASFSSTGTVVCGSGTIEFNGTDTFGGTSTTAGTISGGGMIEFNAGTFTFDGASGKSGKGGLVLTVSTLDFASNVGATQVNVAGKLSYAGSFTETAGTAFSLESGAVLSLYSGPALLNGAFAGASGSELVLGAALSTTDDGMSVTGALKILDTGSVSQSGTVTLGVTAGDAGVTLQIEGAVGTKPAGIYTLQNYAAIVGFGAIVNGGSLDKSGNVLGGGTSSIAPAFTNSASANVTASTGLLVFNAGVKNDGTISATTGGTIQFGGAVSVAKGDTGTIEVNSTGFAIFDNGVVAAETLLFTDAEGHAVITDPGVFDATISGFQAVTAGGVVTQSDSIDLTTIYNSDLSATYTPTNTANTSGILTLTETVNGQATTVAKLHFAGTYTAASFAFAVDSSGQGTLITDPPVSAQITPQTLGAASVAFTNTGSGLESAVLPGAGNGVVKVFGFSPNGQDVLDLRKILASADGHPSLADLGNYITASVTGDNTTLSYDPTGHGGGSAFAVLDGVNTTMSSLLAHHALSLT